MRACYRDIRSDRSASRRLGFGRSRQAGRRRQQTDAQGVPCLYQYRVYYDGGYGGISSVLRDDIRQDQGQGAPQAAQTYDDSRRRIYRQRDTRGAFEGGQYLQARMPRGRRPGQAGKNTPRRRSRRHYQGDPEACEKIRRRVYNLRDTVDKRAGETDYTLHVYEYGLSAQGAPLPQRNDSQRRPRGSG